ncbi:MAG: hypothetical protein J1F02_11900 [Lachnospiraceae bacterium]|nr:hypothetical protein [Lachnospiraceae bacterium]
MKEFTSILFTGKNKELQKTAPLFFTDLQLDYLLGILENQSKGYSLRPYFYTLPKDLEEIAYRQEIYAQLADPALTKALQQFCIRMQRSRRSHSLALQCEEKIQAASYYLEAASRYCEAVSDLSRQLAESSLFAEGFLSFRETLSALMKSYEDTGFLGAVHRAAQFLGKIRFTLVISSDKITITEEPESDENYLKELAELLSLKEEEVKTVVAHPFPNALEPSFLETTLMRIIKKSQPDIFQEIEEFYQSYPNFYSETLLTFETEVQFYLSAREFQKKTEALGYHFCKPALTEEERFAATGNYDLALVWKNAHREYSIITNSFSYPDHASFFVVTGPNQGGKTTFARAMGQAVYFSLMGLEANASTITIPFFEGISTHFEVEESVKSNSGKLKEEIDRLAPMMKSHIKRHFIVLNELFTTATTYDALIMGRKVMEHFLERECYGIYVTHIQELAEDTGQIRSLVAQIEKEKKEKRTYQILPMQAQGYGYSESLVKQFELTYEDVKRRLS